MYNSRNYTTLGEKIVSVVGTLTLGLILIGLFYTYRVIEASFLLGRRPDCFANVQRRKTRVQSNLPL
jgi:hypothetical protein